MQMYSSQIYATGWATKGNRPTHKFCLKISQNSIFSDQVQPEEKLKLKGAMPLHSIGGVPGKLEKLQKTN